MKRIWYFVLQIRRIKLQNPIILLMFISPSSCKCQTLIYINIISISVIFIPSLLMLCSKIYLFWLLLCLLCKLYYFTFCRYSLYALSLSCWSYTNRIGSSFRRKKVNFDKFLIKVGYFQLTNSNHRLFATRHQFYY